MLEISVEYEDGSRRFMSHEGTLLIGRAMECGLRIPNWRVGRRHARLVKRGEDVVLEDLGTLTGTLFNGNRVAGRVLVTPADQILIGPCLLRLRAGCPDTAATQTPEQTQDPTRPLAPTRAQPETQTQGLERANATEKARVPRMMTGDTAFSQGHGVTGSPRVLADTPSEVSRPLCAAGRTRTPCASACPITESDCAHPAEPDLAWLARRRQLHAALLTALDLRRRDVSTMSDAALRREAGQLLTEILAHRPEMTDPASVDRLQQEVLDEAVGLGPLEPLLADTQVSEIMVNRHDEIYVECQGRLQRHAGAFADEQSVRSVIERIVSPLGRRIDESSPMVDARLPDGSRVNAVLPPVALRGACLTIRKFPAQRLALTDLIALGALSDTMAKFLHLCVTHRKNMIVSGGTGSGKTTLLNVLSCCVPEGERIVTIEDAAELQLSHRHRVALEARPANMEGKGLIVIRDLVRNALRMRPDRIVVGECRGAEALDMLSAMNTGHEGSLTTLHANSPRDALARLETMVLMAECALPLTAIREQIASSIDLIVQQARLPDGRRRVTEIVEISGLESGRFQLQTLFRHDASADRFSGAGVLPGFAPAWQSVGVPLNPSWFSETASSACGPEANASTSWFAQP